VIVSPAFSVDDDDDAVVDADVVKRRAVKWNGTNEGEEVLDSQKGEEENDVVHLMLLLLEQKFGVFVSCDDGGAKSETVETEVDVVLVIRVQTAERRERKKEFLNMFLFEKKMINIIFVFYFGCTKK
jgi:hypothetical protein